LIHGFLNRIPVTGNHVNLTFTGGSAARAQNSAMNEQFGYKAKKQRVLRHNLISNT
jgi:hypothetical protein